AAHRQRRQPGPYARGGLCAEAGALGPQGAAGAARHLRHRRPGELRRPGRHPGRRPAPAPGGRPAAVARNPPASPRTAATAPAGGQPEGGALGYLTPAFRDPGGWRHPARRTASPPSAGRGNPD
ncbi:Uncharacterized protein APZ42_002877, partial [Daphnia magna]